MGKCTEMGTPVTVHLETLETSHYLWPGGSGSKVGRGHRKYFASYTSIRQIRVFVELFKKKCGSNVSKCTVDP